MNFCSHCGSDRLELKTPPLDSRPRYVCAACGKVHYVNPKVVVGCLPVYENRVLLCRRSIEPRHGLWNLPAGYLESGETAEEGARRETREEACADVEILRLHTLYSLPHIDQVYLFFLAKLHQPVFGVGEETLEVDLFTEAQIPWKDIAFSSTEFALRRFFAEREARTVHLGQLVR